MTSFAKEDGMIQECIDQLITTKSGYLFMSKERLDGVKELKKQSIQSKQKVYRTT